MSYVRVGILGQTTGGEVWSVNPVYDPSLEFGSGVDQSALDAAAAAIALIAPGVQLLAGLSTLMQITGARLEVRNDTDDSLMAISVAQRATPLNGTSSPKMPLQAASVFSLRTNTPGASGRGRLYWPALGFSIAATGRLDSTFTGTINGQMKTYLLAIRDALATAFPTIGFNVAVRSRLTKTTPHVVRMQCGDVVDTQRRRRDNFPEAYNSVTIP